MTSRADYWISDCGRAQLYCGDNLDVMRNFPDGAVDVVITSPPYNLGTTTGGGFPQLGHYRDGDAMPKRGGQGKWSRASQGDGIGHGYENYDDAMPHADYVAWQHRVLNECWRVANGTGAIYYNHKPRVLGGQVVTPMDYNPGLPLRQVIIWARAGGINFSPAFYVPTHEWILLLAKHAFRLKSKGASGVGDVWQIAQEANDRHPAPFPLQLPMRIVETTDRALYLDPFSGSATTIIAALRYGRSAIGIEKSRKYFEASIERVKSELAQPNLFKSAPAIQARLFGQGSNQ